MIIGRLPVTDIVATLMQSMLGSLGRSQTNTGGLLPLRERPLVLQQSDVTFSFLAVQMDAVFRAAIVQQGSAN